MPDDDKDTDKKTDDFAVKFKTEGEYLASVEKKLKSKVKAAVDEATAGLLSKLGVESVDDIEGLIGKVKSSEGAVTEVEKLKSTHDKTAKELAKEQKRTAELSAKLQGLARRDALAPFAPRVRSLKALTALLEGQLTVDENGAVAGPEGKSVESLVEELLKTEDYLKAPDFKEGGGTKPTSKKVDAGYFKPASDTEPLSKGRAMLNELIADGKIPPPNGVAGP